MKTTYHSKRVRPALEYTTYAGGNPRIYTTVVSPQTGKPCGLMIEDKCGEIAVYGPTFVWPTIKSIIRESLGQVEPTALIYMQQKVNDRYCGMEC